MARVFASTGPTRRAEPGGRDARRSLDRRPARLHRHQHRRHVRAARGGARVLRGARRRGARRASGSCTSRPTRCTARSAPTGCSARRRRTRRTRRTRRARPSADHLVRAYSTPTACRSLITNCSNNYGPYQFPEKLIPLMILNALDGAAAADLRRRRQRPRLAARRGPLRGHPARCSRTGRAGREVQHRRRQRADRTCRSSIGSATRSRSSARPRRTRRCARRAPAISDLKTFVADRPGPRSPLRDRRHEDRARELGWAPRHDVRDGPARRPSRWYLEHRDWCERSQAGRYDRAAPRSGTVARHATEGHHPRRRLRLAAASADARASASSCCRSTTSRWSTTRCRR